MNRKSLLTIGMVLMILALDLSAEGAQLAGKWTRSGTSWLCPPNFPPCPWQDTAEFSQGSIFYTEIGLPGRITFNGFTIGPFYLGISVFDGRAILDIGTVNEDNRMNGIVTVGLIPLVFYQGTRASASVLKRGQGQQTVG